MYDAAPWGAASMAWASSPRSTRGECMMAWWVTNFWRHCHGARLEPSVGCFLIFPKGLSDVKKPDIHCWNSQVWFTQSFQESKAPACSIVAIALNCLSNDFPCFMDCNSFNPCQNLNLLRGRAECSLWAVRQGRESAGGSLQGNASCVPLLRFVAVGLWCRWSLSVDKVRSLEFGLAVVPSGSLGPLTSSTFSRGRLCST